ncbi:MAG TPA: nuclear transport factor 2 family protein [Candidatus Nanopelagicaceae bacterium]|nr:nuclear transport factor 2 family protein [Candidatus Nanopelagicaceae bacterium]
MSNDVTTVRTLVDELVKFWAGGERARLATMLDPNVTSWVAVSGRHTGREATMAMLDTLGSHIADGNTRTECVIAAADLAVAEVASTPLSAVHGERELKFTVVVKVANAHIVEVLIYLDPLHLLQEDIVTAS